MSYLLTNLCEFAVGDLDAPEKAVLRVLCAYADDDGENCHPSVPTLERYSRGSESTVRRALRRLQERGWIKVLGETWRTCHYTVIVGRLRGAYVDPKRPPRPQDPCHPGTPPGGNTPVIVTPPPVTVTPEGCHGDTRSSSGSVSREDSPLRADPCHRDTPPVEDIEQEREALERDAALMAAAVARRSFSWLPLLADFRDPYPGETHGQYRAAQDEHVKLAVRAPTVEPPAQQIRDAAQYPRGLISAGALAQAVTPPRAWSDALDTIEIELPLAAARAPASSCRSDAAPPARRRGR